MSPDDFDPRVLRPVTYIPPLWLHRRAIVRQKGVPMPEYVIRRVRLRESREASTAEVIPVDVAYGDVRGWDAGAQTLTIAELEDGYESTDRTMSVVRAPL